MVLVALLALGGSTACTADGTDPAPPPTSIPTGDPGGVLPVVDALAEWRTVAERSSEAIVYYPFAADTYAALLHHADGYAVGIVRPGSSATLPIDDGWTSQEPFRVGESLVFGEANEDAGTYRIRRWDGRAVEAEVVYESDYWSEAVVIDATLFLTVAEDGRICIDAIDMTAADPSATLAQVWCPEGGSEPWWLKSEDSALSFLSGADRECATAHRLDPADLTVTDVEEPGCISRGIATRDLVVWTEPPVPDEAGYENWFDTQMRALADGTLVELGSAVAGSPTACNGAIYWLHQTTGTEVRRWRPGDETVQVVYRSAVGGGTDAYTLGAPTCVAGTVTVNVLGGPPTDYGDELVSTPARAPRGS